MDQRKTISGLLRALADCIDGASSEQIRALESGKAKLYIGEAISNAKAGDSKSKSNRLSEQDVADVESIVQKLHSLGSREEGIVYLQGLTLTRKELERLARRLNAPVVRQDNMERLRDKVIETSIGYKLNSKAIRGELNDQDDIDHGKSENELN